MIGTIEKAFGLLVKLLQYEANKHRKAGQHLDSKAHNHRANEQKAVAKIKQAGSIYRTSLYSKADEHERHELKARQLAEKIGKVFE